MSLTLDMLPFSPVEWAVLPVEWPLPVEWAILQVGTHKGVQRLELCRCE
jgi:hypothetical protein